MDDQTASAVAAIEGGEEAAEAPPPQEQQEQEEEQDPEQEEEEPMEQGQEVEEEEEEGGGDGDGEGGEEEEEDEEAVMGVEAVVEEEEEEEEGEGDGGAEGGVEEEGEESQKEEQPESQESQDDDGGTEGETGSNTADTDDDDDEDDDDDDDDETDANSQEEDDAMSMKVDWDRAAALVGALGAGVKGRAPFADVHFRLDDGGVVKAHQVVIAPYSRLLSRLFKQLQCCRGADRCLKRETAEIHLHDVRKRTLAQLIDVVYTGACSFKGEKEQREFCKLIKMMDMRFPTSSGLDLASLAGYEKPKELPSEHAEEDKEETSMLRSLLNTPSNSAAEKPAPPPVVEEELLSCSNCDFSTSSRKDLYNHSLSCTPKPDKDIIAEEEEDEEEEVASPCIFCKDMTMPNRKELLMHYSERHFANHLKKEFSSLAASGACPECGLTLEASSKELFNHLGVEHAKVEKYLKYCEKSDRDLSCLHCLDDFEQPSNLVKHLANKHYSQTLKDMYAFNGDCPMPNCKRTLASAGQQLSHLSLKHNVLYKIVPPGLSQKLQKLIAIERKGLAEKRLAAQAAANGEQQPAAATAAPSPAAKQQSPVPKGLTGLQMPKLATLLPAQQSQNLACPLCELRFKSPKGLTAHLVQHYLPMIERKYASVISKCPFCEFQHGTRAHLLHHVVVSHRKLQEFVPLDIRQMLKGTGIFDGPGAAAAAPRIQQLPGANGSPSFARLTPVSKPPGIQLRQNLMPMPPQSVLAQAQQSTQQQHPAFQAVGQVDMRKVCPGCDQVFGIQSSLNRHISNVHIKAELLNNCDTLNMRCKLCPGVFKDVRTLVTHIGISHGFIKRFIAQETQRKKLMGGQAQQASPGLRPAARFAIASPVSASPAAAAAASPAAAATASPQQSSSGEQVNYVCPICNKVGFPTWTTWKKHIFHHMSSEIRAHYENIGKDCPICGKHFESFGQNTLHVAVIHNKVFNFLPPEMRLAIKKAGLTSNKSKRQILCPLCPGEKAMFGEMTFKQHLYQHVSERIRQTYAKNGRQCCLCRFSAHDVETVVQHVAIYHNKIVDYLAPDIVQRLKLAGVTFAPSTDASPVASTSAASSGLPKTVSFPNGSISLTRVSQQQPAGTPTPQKIIIKSSQSLAPRTPSGLPSSQSASPSATPGSSAASPMFVNQKPLIYREGTPVLHCPICNRDDFKKRLHLKRHLLSIHFKKAFYTRFGHIDKQCPFCQYVTPCHNEALRHVAFTHKQLKEVMPDDLLQQLIDNGVMELDALEEKGKGEDPVPILPPAGVPSRADLADQEQAFEDGSSGGGAALPLPERPAVRYEPPKPQYSRAKPILYCPVCQRQEFPTRLYLKRHILAHYMSDFKERYKDYPLVCPYCSHPSGCVKHNMIHIAITHRKLKDLLPENLAIQLVQNGILEINDESPEQQALLQQQAAQQQLQQQQQDAAQLGGDDDAMDPSMFMDMGMTEDQNDEPLEFGGQEAASPRKRARDDSFEMDGASAAKRSYSDGAGPSANKPVLESELVQPDLMYPNSDQVDLHTCMVCGTRLSKPHDMRRHMLTHYRPFLRAETAAHNKVCPLCNTQIKHSDKYLFHYFLTHRQFYNIDALPEQVKKHLGRSIESNLAHNQRYPLIAAESTLNLETESGENSMQDYSQMEGHAMDGDEEEEEAQSGADEGVMDAPVVEDDDEEEDDMDEPVMVQPLQEMTYDDDDEAGGEGDE